MNERSILEEIVRIILRHAKPARIYFHGSRALGEAAEASDLDVAYDDPACEDHALIEEEVAKLPTLLKIDVRNLARADERFAERVRATGRVLYSATKRLRFEDAAANFRRAFDEFSQTLDRRPVFFEAGFHRDFPDLLAKRFEFAFDMAWKALRRYFDYVGLECRDPRSAFREAYAAGLVPGEDVWLDMIEHRDLTAEGNDLPGTAEVAARAEPYREALRGLLSILEEKLAASDGGWTRRFLSRVRES